MTPDQQTQASFLLCSSTGSAEPRPQGSPGQGSHGQVAPQSREPCDGAHSGDSSKTTASPGPHMESGPAQPPSGPGGRERAGGELSWETGTKKEGRRTPEEGRGERGCQARALVRSANRQDPYGTQSNHTPPDTSRPPSSHLLLSEAWHLACRLHPGCLAHAYLRAAFRKVKCHFPQETSLPPPNKSTRFPPAPAAPAGLPTWVSLPMCA